MLALASPSIIRFKSPHVSPSPSGSLLSAQYSPSTKLFLPKRDEVRLQNNHKVYSEPLKAFPYRADIFRRGWLRVLWGGFSLEIIYLKIIFQIKFNRKENFEIAET
jgi:hypothetical protein